MHGFEDQEYTKKVDISIWKRLVVYAYRHKGLLYSIIFMMVLLALGDVVFPLMTGYAIDRFAIPLKTDGLLGFALLYGLLVLFQSASVGFFVSRAGRLEMAMAYDIRKEGFKKLQELSMSFYDKTAVGYLMARMVSDIGRLSEMIAWAIVDVMWGVAFIIFSFAQMFIMNAKIAAIVFLIMPPLAVISGIFQTKILQWQRKVRRTNSRITGAFNEGILGAMTTKTLVRESKNIEEFSELTGTMRGYSIKAATLSAIFLPIVLFIGHVGTALAVNFGGMDVYRGIIEIGTLAVFINLTRHLFEPVQNIARILAEMQTAQASAERVLGLIDAPLDIVETPEVIELFGDNFIPKTENWPGINGDIEFANVTFSYGSDEKILTDFNLKIAAGETLALVGETGAGKSTIVNLICRFYEPTEGGILIDGVDYRERTSLWLEKSLGYVLQTPHLFSGSIADNIKYGKRDASEEEIISAAEKVGAHEFISGLPDGYDTEVGEEGARLSTGQKQLISFARVILADPRIFVLDEATSSIDTETEQIIQNAITHVLENRTSVIIAHRLSTIRSADRILVIGDGRIMEEGDHNRLMRMKGHYFDLYTNQFKEEQTSTAIGAGGS